jgi:Holin of 3TMs, for gene-transfer release
MFDIPAAVEAVSNLADSAIKRIWPDATQVEIAKIQQVTDAMKQEMAAQMAQLEINKVEAASSHWFVAAGRPAVIWVGVLNLLYSGIGVSFLTWLAACFGLPPLPIVDSTTTNNILMALLGIAGMRSFDKSKGTDTKTISK